MGWRIEYENGGEYGPFWAVRNEQGERWTYRTVGSAAAMLLKFQEGTLVEEEEE